MGKINKVNQVNNILSFVILDSSQVTFLRIKNNFFESVLNHGLYFFRGTICNIDVPYFGNFKSRRVLSRNEIEISAFLSSNFIGLCNWYSERN